ncbi:MAG: adenylate/guanylate cyclase domain-containing protein [Thermodesulfobacteriota bacterium]
MRGRSRSYIGIAGRAGTCYSWLTKPPTELTGIAVSASRRKNPAPSWDAHFERFALVSEHLRVRLLSLAFLGSALFSLLTFRASSWVVPVALGSAAGFPAKDLLSLFLALLAAYEWGVGRIVSWFLKTGRRFPTPGLYGNAFVETSTPTLGMLLASRMVSIEALHSPMVLFYFIFIGLSVLRLRPRLCLFTGLVAGMEYMALSAFLLNENPAIVPGPLFNASEIHVERGLVFILAGVAMGFVAWELKKRMREAFRSAQGEERVRQVFGQHVSPEVVESLLANRDQAIEESERTVCVLFFDIRSFTRMSESMAPGEVIGYLNTLFGALVECVNRHHGIINKFLGDGFLAIFGAPVELGNPCDNAVAAALEILETTDRVTRENRLPETRVGIGCHAGPVVTGTVGSALRKEYTVIGDTVNLASRIESENKNLGSSLLVSQAVYEALSRKPSRAIDLGETPVRGRKNPVRLFRLA